MNEKNTTPKTLLEATQFFSDANVATEFFAKMRWPNGVVCPNCGSTNVLHLPNQRRWKCREKHERCQFSAKTGTIFEESPIGMDKWLVAIWCITNAKNGISSCELARAIGITQKSAWHMLHRVRHAMHSGSFAKFGGSIEADESYIGGAAENMHAHRRKARIKAPGVAGKDIVQGILKRDAECSKVVARVVPDGKRSTLAGNIRDCVEPGSIIYTDCHPSYNKLHEEYLHAMIDHAIAYVAGHVHTNGMENFWSLLKRTLSGTYVSVDAPHLCRYVDEQVFRFNERKTDDAGRFNLVLPGVIGKRLTYKALIGEGSEGLTASEGNAGDGSGDLC